MSDAIAAARERFPALTAPGAPVFLDNPGGTQVPADVIGAMAGYLARSNANAHGAFDTSRRTDAVIEEAHAALADLLGAEPGEVAFGPNMTTLTFALSSALGRERRAGDELVVTTLDHDANIAPWLLLGEDRQLRVRQADIDPEDCTLDLASFEAALGGRPRVVAFCYASNAVGTVTDVARLTRMAHDAGALVYVDAVHYAPHGPIDVKAIGCDFLACSPYKFFGPHAGALYVRRDHAERLRAYKVRPAEDQPPFKWETGTQSHEAMAGTIACIDYLASLAPAGAGEQRRERVVAALEAIRRYERGLSARLLEGLSALPVTVHGSADPEALDRRVPTFAITAGGLGPRRLAAELGRRGFNVWDGNYYALALMERLSLEGSGGALRIGAVHYNTPAEIDRFLSELAEILAAPPPLAVPATEEPAEVTSAG